MQLESIARRSLPLLGLLLAGQASAQSHNANFDSVAEGAIGSTYVEDGLTISDLDRYMGTSNGTFTAEDASGSLGGVIGFTAPNALGFGGYSPGPGAAYSRCGSFQIAAPGTFDHGQLALILAGSTSAGNLVTLEARLGGVLVGSDAVTVPGTFGPHSMTLSVSGSSFDTLHLVGTGSQNSGSFFALVDSILVETIASGTPFCFGDGSATICPCGNFGGADEGCANSTGLGGQVLSGGSASVAADNLTFQATQLPTNKPALCFSGASAANGGAGNLFGDGLMCVSGDIQRHDVRFTDANGEADWGPNFASNNGWGAGVTRHFQIWYRDPAGPCGTQFNVTNAVQVDFGL